MSQDTKAEVMAHAKVQRRAQELEGGLVVSKRKCDPGGLRGGRRGPGALNAWLRCVPLS